MPGRWHIDPVLVRAPAQLQPATDVDAARRRRVPDRRVIKPSILIAEIFGLQTE